MQTRYIVGKDIAIEAINHWASKARAEGVQFQWIMTPEDLCRLIELLREPLDKPGYAWHAELAQRLKNAAGGKLWPNRDVGLQDLIDTMHRARVPHENPGVTSGGRGPRKKSVGPG